MKEVKVDESARTESKVLIHVTAMNMLIVINQNFIVAAICHTIDTLEKLCNTW